MDIAPAPAPALAPAPAPASATGRFHVKGPRKTVNVENLIFFDEILKIIRQFDDFGRFLNIF